MAVFSQLFSEISVALGSVLNSYRWIEQNKALVHLVNMLYTLLGVKIQNIKKIIFHIKF